MATKESIVLERATRITLSQAIVDQLLTLIRQEALFPGDKLPSEDELSRRLAVGRSSIRGPCARSLCWVCWR